MTVLVDFNFYQTVYQGSAIPTEEEFRELSREAEAKLRRYERIYTVTGGSKAKSMAICAMSDSLYGFQTAQSGGVVTSSSVGSVSTSYQAVDVDVSAKAQSQELYRRACLYLDISRGCGA